MKKEKTHTNKGLRGLRHLRDYPILLHSTNPSVLGRSTDCPMALGTGILLLLALICSSPYLLLLFLPLVTLIYPAFFSDIFFLNRRRTLNPNFTEPSAKGVKSGGRCFYLQGEQGRLGVWHLLPMALATKYTDKENIETSVAQETFPVIFYTHGNTYDRTLQHRIGLYNVLNQCGFHVFCFDYRGYGDSEGFPTEDGITSDTRVVYDYVSKIAGGKPIIIWGHSMGTGVATRFVRELSQEGRPPKGLILESAFNNLHDVILSHPFTLPYRFLPCSFLDTFVVDRFRQAGLQMTSDLRIVDISCAILLLHAADDIVIPVTLARRLVAAAKTGGRDAEYVEFPWERRLAHKFIYKAEELPAILEKFANKCNG